MVFAFMMLEHLITVGQIQFSQEKEVFISLMYK